MLSFSSETALDCAVTIAKKKKTPKKPTRSPANLAGKFAPMEMLHSEFCERTSLEKLASMELQPYITSSQPPRWP